jgi:hypothetical protein
VGWLQVYFRHKDGSFEALDAINQGQQVYYAYQADDEAFPPGFRMIAGRSAARTKKQPPNARDNYIIHDVNLASDRVGYHEG